MNRQVNQLYEFAPFLLDAHERLLLRDGKPIAITPKAFETLLLMLVQNNGQLMLKDDLSQVVVCAGFGASGCQSSLLRFAHLE